MFNKPALILLIIAPAIWAQSPNPPKPIPAFPGQTEAPLPVNKSTNFIVETITDQLSDPWSVAFLPDGSFLVTESIGNMRIVSESGVVSAPLEGVPDVKRVAAEGLHEVVLDPEFSDNQHIYFTYFAPPKGEAPSVWPITHFYEDVWTLSLAERRTLEIGSERIGKARLNIAANRLEQVDVLYEGLAERRLIFAPDKTMFATGADVFRMYDSDIDSIEGRDFLDEPDITRNFSGRVIRINADGTIPKDNPWLHRATVRRETFAHGLKDPEGAAIHPVTGELWLIDHGPQGGDEINIIKPGADYGWPNYSYGVQYDARQADGRTNVRVGTGRTSAPDVEEPIYFWVPSIAPSGMAFYTGDLFPQWHGNLFVGAMAGQALVRLELDGKQVVSEERLLTELGQRIREVKQGPDGALYLLTPNALLKVVPDE